MAHLSNVKHERFAIAVAGGVSMAESYISVFGKGQGKKPKVIKNPNVLASRLSSRPEVAARIEELKAEASGRLKEETLWTREDLLRWHQRVLTAKPSEAAADSDISEAHYVGKEGRLVYKVVSKQTSAGSMADINGWKKEVVQHDASPQLVEILGGDFKPVKPNRK